MNTHLRFLFFSFFTAALLLPSVTRADRTFYLSPRGNDEASGSRRHPLATLEGALRKARAWRVQGKEGEKVILHLSEGVFPLSHTVQMGIEDNGLVVEGEGYDKTVLTGGVEIQGFREAENGLWALDMQSLMPCGGDIPQFFVNGQRAICARTPNELHFFPTGKADEILVDSVSDRSPGRTGMAATRVQIPDEAVEALRKAKDNSLQLRIGLLHAWDITRRSVQSFSPEGKAVFFSGTRMPTWNRIDREAQFFLENDLSFLDTPGEYFFDIRQNVLYYMPREGEKLSSARAFVPSLNRLLVLQGTAQQRVSDIVFRQLSLSHTRYDITWRGDNPTQAAAQVNAAVALRYAENVSFIDCEIAHTGGWGLDFGTGSRECAATHCYVHDLGAGGIRIGDMTIPKDEERDLSRAHRVENCILRDGGHIFPTGVGVILFQTSDNKVLHNDISDFFYTGVSVGWVWGYSHSPSVRNIINYNHIHHIGWGVLSDMGGVYTLGISPGTEVCHNHIHDIHSLGYGGWGLYTDEGSTGIRMENNLVYRCKSSGFHQHYGENNLIQNNLFINNVKAQLEATRPEPDHLPFTFAHNIILYEQGSMYGIRWNEVNFQSDENLYWNTKGSVTWNGLSLQEWQEKTGKDLHSLVEDPRIADVEGGDFTLRNTAALEKIHFVPFDWKEAGVEGDEEWKKLATYDPARHELYLSVCRK